MPAAVELVGVTKRFGDVLALDRVDLEVRRGEFLALLGPSGCGKTTCLRLVAGFEQATEGELRIGGEDVRRVPPNRRRVNTVFQHYALFEHLSVLDNVAFGLKQRGMGRAERRERAREALELVRLAGAGDRRPRQLSGGQRQRVALARALVLRPEVLLLDEPLGALDLQLRKEMQVELKRIHREVGITFVFVTHDQGEAMAMADRIAVMNAGRIEQLDAPLAIYDRPATGFVASFIGDMSFLAGRVLEAGDGRWVAEADGVRVEGRGPARAGEAVRVALRPEAVALAARNGRGPAANAAPGRLVTALALGDTVQYVVELEGGTQVLARVPRAGGPPPLAAGAEVELRWAPDAPLLLPP
jgi:spermidine/putrescine transport system ATP-binding protein